MVRLTRLIFLAFLCAALAGCSSTTSGSTSAGVPALALSPDPGLAAAAGSPGAADELYYVEFRARTAESYGHTFAMFGRRNARGDILTREVAGLHPASTSAVPYVLGHAIPVPSETGPSDGDLEDQYMTARYRIDLNRAEYDGLVAHIRRLQASSPVWHAVLYNCSAFVSDIAQHLDLRTPSSLLMPEDYINRLREMNA